MNLSIATLPSPDKSHGDFIQVWASIEGELFFAQARNERVARGLLLQRVSAYLIAKGFAERA